MSEREMEHRLKMLLAQAHGVLAAMNDFRGNDRLVTADKVLGAIEYEIPGLRRSADRERTST